MDSRQVQFIVDCDNTVEYFLKTKDISSSVCTQLRKEFGLVQVVDCLQEKLLFQPCLQDISMVGCNECLPRKLRLIDNICKGEVLQITLKDCPTCVPKLDIPINIVYEDSDIAIIDKQYGLAVISSKGHYGRSLENALANIWGDYVYRPVNRLDRDTSGLMIVAKNQLAHSILSESHIVRKYLALCQGNLQGAGKIDQKIALKDNMGMQRIVASNGKNAITLYEVKSNYNNCSLVQLQLLTGRTHQIRVHMQWLGYPLIGDKLYNSQCINFVAPNGKIIDRQCLHSCYIEVESPITKKKVVIESMQPEFV